MTYYIDADNFDWDRFYRDFAGTENESQETEEAQEAEETEFEYDWSPETF